MRIRNLKIKNYRNFKNFEIELKPFTLIIGENNIGKTNLLNALGLIFSQDITFFKRRALELDDINFHAIREFKEDIVDEKDEIRIPSVEVHAILTDFNEVQRAVVGDWFIDNKFEDAKLTYKFQPKGLTIWLQQQKELLQVFSKTDAETVQEFRERKIRSIDFPINKYHYVISGGLDEDKQVDFSFLKALKMEYLDALRDAQTQLVASGDYRLLYKILCNRGNNKFSDIKNVLENLDNIVKNNPELNQLQNDIKSYLAKTSLVEDESYNRIDFQFSRPEENEILKKLSLVYGDSPVNVERNGTGRNNLLYISLILSHLLGLNSPEIAFRLIALEEPEVHLHTHLQEHLSKNIQSEVTDNLQLIVTSHSPHITSKLALENTATLYKKDGDIRSHYILDGFKNADGSINAMAEKHIRYLKRYIDATKSTIFFGRRIILVEGISEQILVPKFFELYKGKTLEKIGCTLVNVNSVAFRHFLEIVRKGFFIKCLVLTDSDCNTKNENRGIKLKEDYENELPELIKVCISSKSTFEKDIMDENKMTNSKERVFDAIKLTRPRKGKTFSESYKDKDIDIEKCFDLIEEKNEDGEKTKCYKAEFAMDLLEVLSQDSTSFNVPIYIKEGFDFLYSTISMEK